MNGKLKPQTLGEGCWSTGLSDWGRGQKSGGCISVLEEKVLGCFRDKSSLRLQPLTWN